MTTHDNCLISLKTICGHEKTEIGTGFKAHIHQIFTEKVDMIRVYVCICIVYSLTFIFFCCMFYMSIVNQSDCLCMNKELYMLTLLINSLRLSAVYCVKVIKCTASFHWNIELCRLMSDAPNKTARTGSGCNVAVIRMCDWLLHFWWTCLTGRFVPPARYRRFEEIDRNADSQEAKYRCIQIRIMIFCF